MVPLVTKHSHLLQIMSALILASFENLEICRNNRGIGQASIDGTDVYISITQVQPNIGIKSVNVV